MQLIFFRTQAALVPPGGRLVREYTALIDPPVQMAGQPAGIEAPEATASEPEAPVEAGSMDGVSVEIISSDEGCPPVRWGMEIPFVRAALIDVAMGKGHVILFGMRPQYRAQSYQCFKLFFNSLVR